MCNGISFYFLLLAVSSGKGQDVKQSNKDFLKAQADTKHMSQLDEMGETLKMINQMHEITGLQQDQCFKYEEKFI